MRCPKCQKSDTRVVESRDSEEESSVRRRRECLTCNYRFTTYERVEVPYLVIKKASGSLEPFDRLKIMAGIQKAVQKRPVSPAQVDQIVNDIEQAIYELGKDEVGSTAIGELVMAKLLEVDDVAYVRFASVYRRFADLAEFEQALTKVRQTRTPKMKSAEIKK